MQLVAYGAQDIYLTGNPQITFFKVVYRRHTNFSMECIEQTFSGTRNFNARVTATISRNGDLVSGLYVVFDPQAVIGKAGVTSSNQHATDGAGRLVVLPNVGFSIINEVDIEIGGQRIDRHFGKWMNVWNDLTKVNPSGVRGGLSIEDDTTGDGVNSAGYLDQTDADPFGNGIPTQYQRTSFNVGPSPLAIEGTGGTANSLQTALTTVRYASVPLDFWFCRNPGLALPLIALQYHEVKINLTIGGIPSRVNPGDGVAQYTTQPDISRLQLWADYIYLDTDERRRFAQVSHEYLIEQVQHQNNGGDQSSQFNLNFNHPVKELIWCGAPVATPTVPTATDFYNTIAVDAGQPGGIGQDVECITQVDSDIYKGASVPTRIYAGAHETIENRYANRLHAHGQSEVKWSLKLNGHDRFAPRHSGYFTGTQVLNHHSGNSGVMIPESIYVYSFALKPEEHQPSGTCNFSRIDNAQLSCEGVTGGLQTANGIDIYAVNYNVLRIMSGMGGLAYSN